MKSAFIICILFLGIISCKGITKTLTQKEILITILTSNPDSYLGWDVNADVSKWRGVVLNNNGDVIELSLRHKGLTNLPKEIGQLTNLSELSLNNNQLTSIPKEVCDLKIRFLDLGSGVTCE